MKVLNRHNGKLLIEIQRFVDLIKSDHDLAKMFIDYQGKFKCNWFKERLIITKPHFNKINFSITEDWKVILK